MRLVTDAEVLTRGLTGYEKPRHSEEALLVLLRELCHAKSPRPGSVSPTATDVWSTQDTLVDGSYELRTHIDAGHSVALAWFASTSSDEARATTSSATTVSSLRHLLKGRLRDERLRRLSPERRRVYDDIKRLRESLGTVDFDVVEALRELREDG